MKKQNILILIAILSALFVEESQSCFSSNVTHEISMWKSGAGFYKDCFCETPILTTKNLMWIDDHDQVILPDGPGSKVYTQWGPSRTLSLVIPNLTKAHSGIYKCVTTSKDGQTFAISYPIEVYDELYFVQTNETQYILNGKDSFITCHARGYSQPLISWYKGEDDAIINNNEKYQITGQGLFIKKVKVDDAGIYKCTARVYQTGEDRDRIIKVEVMTVPVIADVIATPDEVVVEGDPLTLDCKADGYPLPTYTWKKVNQTDTKNLSWIQDFNNITFENITMDDHGTYMCIAKNQVGEANKTISIQVLAAPKIIDFENINETEGNPVTISCAAIGRPQPYINISYYGDGDYSPGYNISNDDPISMSLNLTFEKLEKSHEGLFVCVASNNVGSDQKSMYLKVLHKPYFDNDEEVIWAWGDKQVNLSCENHSQPEAIIQWRYHGTVAPLPDQIEINNLWTSKFNKISDLFVEFTPNKKVYGEYECVAKNSLGESKKRFFVKHGYVPTMVTNVNVTNVAATTATFSIESPESGPEITGFTAEYDKRENYEVTNIHLNRTWAINVPFKVEKLKPNTEYLIRFAAINEVGTGDFNPHYISFTTPEKSVPEPPTWDYTSEPVAISADNKILRLKSPEHNGDPIDYFAIKFCPLNMSAKCVEEKVAPTTEIKLPLLDHNIAYEVEIIAHNSLGNSTPSTLHFFIQEIVVAGLPPGVIIGVSVVVVLFAIFLLDLLLFLTRKQGMIANCCYKKNKKKNEDSIQSKDKKGLLKDNGEASDTLKRADNGHKEFEYNKTTGVITGKHSAV